MKTRIAAITGICLSLTACDLGKVVAIERRAAVIIAINQPKHFGITVRDATGHVERISVAKHCNNWRSHTRLGMKVTVVYERLVYKDGRRAIRVTNRGLRQRLCGGW